MGLPASCNFEDLVKIVNIFCKVSACSTNEVAGISMKQVDMYDPSSANLEPAPWFSEDNKLIRYVPLPIEFFQRNETAEVDYSGAEDSVYVNLSCSSDSVNSVESFKRKCEDLIFHRMPLPYLIRPCMKLDMYDAFDLYNDYAESLSDIDGSDYSDDESDQGQGFIVSDNVQTSPLSHLIPPHVKLDKYENSESLSDQGGSDYLLNDESDEDYIFVENIESLINSEEVRGQASQKEKLLDVRTVNQNDFDGCCSQENSVTQLGSIISEEKERVHETEPVDEEDWEIV